MPRTMCGQHDPFFHYQTHTMKKLTSLTPLPYVHKTFSLIGKTICSQPCECTTTDNNYFKLSSRTPPHLALSGPCDGHAAASHVEHLVRSPTFNRADPEPPASSPCGLGLPHHTTPLLTSHSAKGGAGQNPQPPLPVLLS